MVRYGLWIRNFDDSYTLVASTPNDTTLLSVVNTKYPKALSVPYTKIRGRDYLVGLLIVTAAALPSIVSTGTLGSAPVTGIELLLPTPTKGATIAGQADLPATIAAGTLLNSNYNANMLAILLP